MSVTGKRQVDAGVAFDDALALEVADAAAEQDHLADRQLGGRALGVSLSPAWDRPGRWGWMSRTTKRPRRRPP